MINNLIVSTIPSVATIASGPSYSVIRLCESLNIEGLESILLDIDTPTIQVLPAFLKRFPLGYGPRRLGNSPQMLQWLNTMAKAGRIKLLHNHSLFMMPNIYPGWVAKKYHIPYVVSPRGTLSAWAMRSGSYVKRLFWPLLQRPALNNVTCFHATAESEYNDIRRMGFKQPVAIIPNGIDIPDILVKQSSSVRTLLFLGRIHPIKGLDLLLPAWQLVQDHFPHWQLKIIGPDNDYARKMRHLADTLNLQRIEFCGAKYGQEKLQSYCDADLFILPSYSENFGVAVAEALASGIPAIVTKGAPWHILEEYAAGWWVESEIKPLVDCLMQALSCSTAELALKGNNGIRLVQEKFAWASVSKMMAQMYIWLLNGGTPPECVRLN